MRLRETRLTVRPEPKARRKDFFCFWVCIAMGDETENLSLSKEQTGLWPHSNLKQVTGFSSAQASRWHLHLHRSQKKKQKTQKTPKGENSVQWIILEDGKLKIQTLFLLYLFVWKSNFEFFQSSSNLKNNVKIVIKSYSGYKKWSHALGEWRDRGYQHTASFGRATQIHAPCPRPSH